jgi:hypothetical protein
VFPVTIYCESYLFFLSFIYGELRNKSSEITCFTHGWNSSDIKHAQPPFHISQSLILYVNGFYVHNLYIQINYWCAISAERFMVSWLAKQWDTIWR